MTPTSEEVRQENTQVKRTEKGWAGHFIAASSCLFRRHTMLEYGDINIGISTVGNYKGHDGKMESIGAFNRCFETMAFHGEPATPENPWKDPNISRQISFESNCAIEGHWKEQEANDMHEAVVAEITAALLSGKKYNTQP